MNCPSANSGGSAGVVSTPPPLEFFLVLPDGSCIPATPQTCQIVMRQARSDARKQARIKRHEKAVQLQMVLEDRAAARALQQELAELHRGSLRWAARLKVQVKPDKSDTQTSPVTKGIFGTMMKAAPMSGAPRPASSWVVDVLGMKGVIWQQSYLGRKSPNFRRGAARANWEYIVRDEAVLRDEAGKPVVISNMGDDWIEIGAAWQALEDASTRANAKIQMLAIAPFDSDMSEAEMIAALTHFCKTVLEPLDLPYSAATHGPPAQGDVRNFHPHIAFSLRPMRRIEPYCWEVADEVCGELDGRDGVQMLRHLWAHSMTTAAEQAQSNRRYTGLGYGARNLDLETGEHLGEGRSAMVARGGHVWAQERNRIKAARNAARRAIRDADHKIAALTKVRDAAVKRLERRADVTTPAKIVRAALTVEPATTLSRVSASEPADVLTRSKPTAPVAALSSTPAIVSAPQIITATVPPVDAAVIVAPQAPAPATIRPTSDAPIRDANRRSMSRTADPAHRLRANKPSKPVLSLDATGRPHRAAAPLVPVAVPIVDRRLVAARPVRPPVTLVAAVANATGRHDIAMMLLDALALARSRRLRRRRIGEAADGLRLDTLPVLGDVATLGTLPSLDRLVAEAMGRVPSEPDLLGDDDRARIARLVTIDAYVADYNGADRHVETDYPALRAIGVGWDWLKAPAVQVALRSVRDEQQHVLAALAREAGVRPLAFAKNGSRFWPCDLPADQLRRLDRWATDPGFQQDVFEAQQVIGRAHVARDTERRAARRTDNDAGAGALPSVPDGFGGLRQGPAPVFQDDGIRARIEAFDRMGRPTDQLLQLLMLAAQHPHQIEVASDGRLMALPGKPAMLAPLLHGWRSDDPVSAVVTETVRASREAGNPVWPASVDAAVRSHAVRTSGAFVPAAGRAPSDLGRGPER